MTIEEAIAHAKEQTEIFAGKHRVFLYLAIEALEKQVPKKPFQLFGTHSFKCTNCYKFVAHEVDDNCDLMSLAEWCPYCGQHIDWKVEE